VGADEPHTMLVARRECDAELPRATPLAHYVTEHVLGVGGHGIVYRAHDAALQRPVAIKEYMPATIATRTAAGRIEPRLPRFEAAYAAGLRSFLEEARLLAQFDHPALVKVHQFWSDNGTAYMAMTLAEGITMKQWLAALGAPPPERALRALALELIDVLGMLHRQHCFHRDIAPDNILLRLERGGDGTPLPRPLLLDFGSARRVVGEATQQLTALLKIGYSPPEQYEGETSARQGPWTDVYALGAVLYTAVSGAPPPSSIARVIDDQMTPALQAGAGRYSAGLLAAIDAALAVRPQARPRSMEELRALLEQPPPSTPAAASALPQGPAAGAAPLRVRSAGAAPSVPAGPAAAAVSAAPAAPAARRGLRAPVAPAAWPWFAAAGAVALAALLLWWLR